MNQTVINVLAIIGAISLLRILFNSFGLFSVLGLYMTIKTVGAPASLFSLFMMKIRKVDMPRVVHSYIVLFKSQIPTDLSDLELTFLEGRNLENISNGLVYAKQKGISFNLDQAKEADRNGLDIIEEIDNMID